MDGGGQGGGKGRGERGESKLRSRSRVGTMAGIPPLGSSVRDSLNTTDVVHFTAVHCTILH